MRAFNNTPGAKSNMNEAPTGIPKRFTAHPRGMGIVDVLSVGRHDRQHAENDFIPHVHGPRRLEVVFLAKGQQVFVLDGRRFVMHGGDALVVRPGQRHAAGEVSQEKALLYWLLLDLPERGSSFLTMTGPHIKRLMRDLRNPGPSLFPAPPAVHRHFDSIIALLRGIEAGDEIASASLYANVLLLLASVLDGARNQTGNTSSPWAARATAYIEEHIEDRLKVRDLAALMGSSAARFTARFEKEVGIPPSHFILRRRIDRAIREMKARPDRAITDIAMDLGFSSSQYFATVFKRFTGHTPKDFLAKTPQRHGDRPADGGKQR
jgi:AraC-like DNA-binding protein